METLGPHHRRKTFESHPSFDAQHIADSSISSQTVPPWFTRTTLAMSQALSRRALVFGPAFRAQLQQRLPQLQQRAASGKAHKRTASPAAREESQGKVLEKPDRFRPPSHPQKLRSPAPIRHYGPSLSAEERAAQRKRKYPNMMPPEGSFMFWFLTNRTIHMWIPLVCVLPRCEHGSWKVN